MYLSQSAYQKLENGKTSLRCEQIVLLIREFGEGAKDLLEWDGIEITIRNDAEINSETKNNNTNNVSNEILYEILNKINDLNVRLNN